MAASIDVKYSFISMVLWTTCYQQYMATPIECEIFFYLDFISIISMVVSRDTYKYSGMRNDSKHVATRRDGFYTAR
jgi:hypothetical protein